MDFDLHEDSKEEGVGGARQLQSGVQGRNSKEQVGQTVQWIR